MSEVCVPSAAHESHHSQQPLLPPAVRGLALAYALASLLHFAHNAEFIAFYPGMPAWLTREAVYMAWLAVSAVGLAGWLAGRLRWRAAGIALVGLYGALGLDGLGHYTLALCSQHTLATNLSIWAEALLGLALLLACAVLFARRVGWSAVRSRLRPA